METKLIYEGEFLHVHQMLNLPFFCLKNEWRSNSKDMQEHEFKSEIEQWCKIVEKHQAYATFVDTLEFKFVVNQDLQEWYNTVITPRKAKAGMKKMSFIAPASAIAKLSISNLFFKQDGIEFKHFSDNDEAMNWIKQDYPLKHVLSSS